MASAKLQNELQNVFADIEAENLSPKEIDAKIKKVKDANKKINEMLSTGDIPGDPKNIVIIPAKVLAAGGAVATVTAIGGIGLLGLSAIVAVATIPIALITAISLAFAPGKERLKGIRDVNNETIKFLEKLKNKKAKNESVYIANPVSDYDYTHEAVWNGFLMNRISEQIEMNRYISECCAIYEGVDTFGSLQAINEGISDKIKNGWEKAKTFFKKIWAKFIERLTAFFSSNQAYLDKYKEIILKKPMKALEKVEMADHTVGTLRIINCTAPIMTQQLLEQIYEKLNNKEEVEAVKVWFIDKYLMHGDSFNAENKEKVEYAEFAKKYFQGGEEKSIPGGSLKLADMYEFCRDFSKIKSALEKDDKSIQQSYTNCETEMNKLARNVQKEAAAYSVIHELEVTKADNNNNSGNGSTASGSGVVNTSSSSTTAASNIKDKNSIQ